MGWQMSPEERIAEANKLKPEGTELFKKKLFGEASSKYEHAASYAVDEGVSGDDIPEAERPLYISCWSNVAMCNIKLTEWADATQACNKVLETESEETTNIK